MNELDGHGIDWGKHISNKTKLKTGVAKNTGGGDFPTVWDSIDASCESLQRKKANQTQPQKPNSYGTSKQTPCGTRVNFEREVDEDCSDLYRRHNVTEKQHSVAGNHTEPHKHTKQPRPIHDGDAYSDLRYDPDWRKNLAEDLPLYPVQKTFSQESKGGLGDTVAHPAGDSTKKKLEYKVIRHPVPVKVDTVQPRPPSSSFRLHPAQGQNIPEDASQSAQQSSESIPRLNLGRNMNAGNRFSDENFAENFFSSPPQRRQEKERKKQYEIGEENDDIAASAWGRNQAKLGSTPHQKSEKVKQIRASNTIVERNKATLGKTVQQPGSYLKTYKQKGRKHADSNQLPQSADDIVSQGSVDNALDPDLMLIQKTPKLKVHEEDKCSDRSGPQPHKFTPKVLLNPPGERLKSRLSLYQQATPDSESIAGSAAHESFSSATNVNLNINLNNTAQLGEPVYMLDPSDSSHRKIGPDVYVYNSPSFKREVSPMDHGHHRKGRKHLQDGASGTGSKPTINTHQGAKVYNNSGRSVLVWPPYEKPDTNLNAPGTLFSEEDVFLSHTYQGGAYVVLPPIGRARSSDPEPHSDRTDPNLNAMHRSSSESYLAQLETQSQNKAKTTYKPYTLKDYHSLKQKVNLGGLGPSNIISENTAEKIRRQKLYSNVIREQNKKISRIPFLPPRNPEANNNRDTAPRNKALEYARTIAKPKVPKDKPKKEIESVRTFDHSGYLHIGMDVSQITTVEMLRRRHEEEKQAVAAFKGFHGTSSTLNINQLIEGVSPSRA